MKDPHPKQTTASFKSFEYPFAKDLSPQKVDTDIQSENQFINVVLNRRSRSNFRKASPSLKEIGNILYLATRIEQLKIDKTGYFVTKRTTPSAGGRHPIDILISSPEQLRNRILRYYNPLSATLTPLEIPKRSLTAFFQQIDRNITIDNTFVIWFSVQPAKTESKYRNADSLIWKDIGALLYCLQLLSTYSGLTSCPVGTLATNSFVNLFHSEKVVSGGGILIGN